MTHDIATRNDIIAELSARLEAAEAEVERLKNETEHLSQLAAHYLGEANALRAEVERIKAQPTAAQERAAIVAMIESLLDDCGRYRGVEDIAPYRVVNSILNSIKLGEHWPTEGEKP